jgi:hypothetical protein
MLDSVPPDAGLQERTTLSTLNVGPSGTRNQTGATCMASSGTNRSAIHHAFKYTITYSDYSHDYNAPHYTNGV